MANKHARKKQFFVIGTTATVNIYLKNALEAYDTQDMRPGHRRKRTKAEAEGQGGGPTFFVRF